MGNHSSVSKSTWTSNISSEDMLTEVLSYFAQPSIPEKTGSIWSSQEPTYRVSINTQPHSSILPFIMQPVTEYRKTPANMKKTTAVANCSESLATLEEILHHGRENKKHTNAEFNCRVVIKGIRNSEEWFRLMCGGGKCMKGVSRDHGELWCVGCETQLCFPEQGSILNLMCSIPQQMRSSCASMTLHRF
ncbi:uncharacterized protein LOC110940696 isoform X1 [Helianthus annuus]|uniref:uncharacterized protein LOC110940696 isoform X1 n=1 Tax=Helianthus annuus TaxID=4232 RepID=UPI000B8FFF2A|nr:uncharacterized protein LOC110940696 isoform X1 [Helianthus annuus]XP_022037939.1 uncharacterized protein LOC110940696 isoform X1 [Helianthus annuus]XP_022037940.1 uncharacterized protein LOC110940696 isoform X1 [Helianthus annuus]XP_022037941.1 uncharacterized protein LOC110940696 isoform X1 [Helianthus annuus]XP_035831694.1 uncharacterized protein LOC110940696 isoform X1 [Helianthus annuus]